MAFAALGFRNSRRWRSALRPPTSGCWWA